MPYQGVVRSCKYLIQNVTLTGPKDRGKIEPQGEITSLNKGCALTLGQPNHSHSFVIQLQIHSISENRNHPSATCLLISPRTLPRTIGRY